MVEHVKCCIALGQQFVVCSIGDNWSFDDEVAAKYGCVVRAFDPRLVHICTVENTIYHFFITTCCCHVALCCLHVIVN